MKITSATGVPGDGLNTPFAPRLSVACSSAAPRCCDRSADSRWLSGSILALKARGMPATRHRQVAIDRRGIP